MLSIGLVSMSQERYYTDLSREDYYTEGGEPEGRWFGEGARQLRLQGQVEKEHLSAMFRGFAPDGEQRLVRNAGSETRRAGFDLTFNAPKSVSVLFAQVGDEHRRLVREAQAEAVKAALSYIEGAAAQVRLGRDGVDVESAGLAVAMFEHSSARLVPGQPVPDPHLHTHAVVVNAGLTASGRSATLDSRALLRHKMAAGVLYRAELFRQLEVRLGLTASRRKKFCELDAVPQELIDEFSKRRRAIERELDERGITEYGKATDDAALRTRTVKPSVDRQRFIEEWQRIGQQHGFSMSARDLELALDGAPTRDVPTLVAEGVERAISRVTGQQSHFAEREFVRALADELEDKGLGADVVLAGAQAYFQNEDIVRVGEQQGEQRFTTREMLELERQLLGDAQDLVRRSHRVRSEHIDRALESRESITREQHAAFLHVTQGRSLSLVRGVAGSGKTYMLEAAREAWEAEGLEVVGAALAATAAKRLEEGSGIASSSLHKLIFDLRKGSRKLTEKSVVVVDEAAMVGTRQLGELITWVHSANAKLVLVGDDRQLQAIDAGAPFASMGKRFGAAEMSEIRRQKQAWAREAVHEFSRGEAKKALRRYAERGLVQVLDSKAEAFGTLTEDFLEAAEDVGFSETMALTGTRAEARRLNRDIQLLRRARSELSEERVELEGELFHIGDRVLFKKNSPKLGVLNGDRGEVVSLSEQEITVRLDDGQRITIHEEEADLTKLQLGYASTTHAAQGATVDRALVLAGGSMQDREATYVQASRAREETRIYADRVTAGDEELEELARVMERSRAKELATDVLDDAFGQELEVA
ncbi:MAG: MobF family relaxase [Cyanobacteria bacterium J06648_11]